MSPGQRRYIEARIARFEERASWLRHMVKKYSPDPFKWMVDELAEYEEQLKRLRGKLNGEEKRD